MSILTSSSACLFNIQSQGSLVSQSAFKKPSMPRKTIQTPEESYSRFSQPIKKIKNDSSLAVLVQPKQQETKARPGKLTIEDVFNTPSESKTSCKDLFLDECADEGSSLSFISSCTSLDSLEEFPIVEPVKATTDSLVMKDDIMTKLNNLLSSQMLNSNELCTFQPVNFLQTLQWDEQALLRNATQYIDPISLMKLNEYVMQEADNNEVFPDFNLFVKNTNQLEAKKNKSESEDGDYYDFYVERESTTYDAAEVSDKSLKSPVYRTIFESEEERSSDKIIRPAFNKSKKQGKTAKKEKKEKPVRPQVERVRREKNKMIEETPNMVEVPVSEDSQATIPMLSFDSEREERVVVKSVWDPETMNAEEFEAYLEQLSELTECTVTDQEAAIKLLKNFGMNISLVLEIVSQNTTLYKEMFRVKVKRLRRNGAI